MERWRVWSQAGNWSGCGGASLWSMCLFESGEHVQKANFFNARPLAKTSIRPPLIAAAASWALAQQN